MNAKTIMNQEKNRKSSIELDYTVTPIPEGTKFRKKKPAVQDWTEALLFAFVVAMIIRNYTFQNFVIPTSSMEKTLLVGDYLVANKMKYFFTDPKREDIVTFRFPYIDEGTPEHPDSKDNFICLYKPLYIDKTKAFSFSLKNFTIFHLRYYARSNIVKRVIGMPGDTLEIRDKAVYIDGKLFQRGYECYGVADPAPPLAPQIIYDDNKLPNTIDDVSINHWYDDYKLNDKTNFNRDWFGPIVVPKGKYFVMGDNRDVSFDSRYWGFLERKDITGSPWVVFWSKGIEFNKLFDTPHIRWDRIFRLAK